MPERMVDTRQALKTLNEREEERGASSSSSRPAPAWARRFRSTCLEGRHECGMCIDFRCRIEYNRCALTRTYVPSQLDAVIFLVLLDQCRIFRSSLVPCVEVSCRGMALACRVASPAFVRKITIELSTSV